MNAPFASPPVAIRAADAGDDGRIDSYVGEHPAATPFHLTSWGHAVAKGCRQRAHWLLAERGGGLAGVLPLTEIHSPLFGRALVSSGFAVSGGPLADSDPVAVMLAEAAWKKAERRSCPDVELRGGALPSPAWTSDSTTYAGFARLLATDDEAELAAIPRKQRAEVRKALAYDLEIDIGCGERHRADHYAVYAASVRNLGTPVFPRALFDAVLDGFGAEADILTVRREGRAIASVLSLYFAGSVMPYWGGGAADARQWRANDLLYFALMRHARERGCMRFDFGRSKTDSGAFAFKKNWGFEPQPLVYHRRSTGEPRSINPASPRYALQVAAWKRLPLALANRLGPPIARGLG